MRQRSVSIQHTMAVEKSRWRQNNQKTETGNSNVNRKKTFFLADILASDRGENMNGLASSCPDSPDKAFSKPVSVKPVI